MSSEEEMRDEFLFEPVTVEEAPVLKEEVPDDHSQPSKPGDGFDQLLQPKAMDIDLSAVDVKDEVDMSNFVDVEIVEDKNEPNVFE